MWGGDQHIGVVIKPPHRAGRRTPGPSPLSSISGPVLA
jgi:hypothetical protein